MVMPPAETETGPSEATDYQRLMGATQEIAQFVLNPDGEIVEWPSGAQAIYGFDEDEVLGQSLDLLYAEGKDYPSLERLLAEAKHDSITRQNWHKRQCSSTGFRHERTGSGYGLSVVRSVIGAHGWDIDVTDGEEGGARFEVTGIEFCK